jgi:hypothetical protein
MSKSIVIICPDTNIKLWVSRSQEAATGGGKSAILKLANAWARLGYDVTIAARVETSQRESLRIVPIEQAAGHYQVAIYVTGSLGRFDGLGIDKIDGRVSIFWIMAPTVSRPRAYRR